MTLSLSSELNCRIVSPSYQDKETTSIYRENKVLGLYNRAYTSFTSQSNTKQKFTQLQKQNLHISPLQKQWLQEWRHSMAWLDNPLLWTVFQIKVHILNDKRWRWAGKKQQQKKKLYIQRCTHFYGRNSSSSTLITLAGMEGSGCSSTSEPNHFERPGVGLLPCRWDPFVR